MRHNITDILLNFIKVSRAAVGNGNPSWHALVSATSTRSLRLMLTGAGRAEAFSLISSSHGKGHFCDSVGVFGGGDIEQAPLLSQPYKSRFASSDFFLNHTIFVFLRRQWCADYPLPWFSKDLGQEVTVGVSTAGILIWSRALTMKSQCSDWRTSQIWASMMTPNAKPMPFDLCHHRHLGHLRSRVRCHVKAVLTPMNWTSLASLLQYVA